MRNNCCSIWSGVRPEVDKMISEAKVTIPVILQGPYNDFLSMLGNYCPVCGHSDLTQDESNEELVRPKKKIVKEVPRKVCPKCNGVGFFGYDGQGFKIACMACLGEGLDGGKSKDQRQNEAEIASKNVAANHALIQQAITSSPKEPESDVKSQEE